MSVKDADGHKLILYPKQVLNVLNDNYNNSLLQVEIGVTNMCNHRCNYCSLDWVNRTSTYIDTDSLISALKDMAILGVKAVYFAGEGEPLLHKSLPLFIETAHKLGMGVSLSTNGSLLTKNISEQILPYLDWIRIGIDAGTEFTYSKIHGVSESGFFKTIDNITIAANIKKANNYKVDIGIQSLLLPENQEEILEMANLIKKTGVDNFQIKPFAQQPFANKRDNLIDYSSVYLKDIKKELEKLNDAKFTVVYREKSMERVSTKKEYHECLGLHFWTLIDASGNVIPCNIFYDKPEYSFGNIHKKRFIKIWNSKKRLSVLKKIDLSQCSDYVCRPELFNRYLWRLKYPECNDCFI